jgi:hypothetical protein
MCGGRRAEDGAAQRTSRKKVSDILILTTLSRCAISNAVIKASLMSAPGEVPEAEIASQRALVLTGDFIDTATPERLAAISVAIGTLIGGDVRGQLVENYDARLIETAEGEPEPVLACKEDFRAFGDEHGYSRVRSGKAWIAVTRARAERSEEVLISERKMDPYPKVRTFDSPDGQEHYFVDLHTVAGRLRASAQRKDAWPFLRHRDTGTVEFLIRLIHEKLGPDSLSLRVNH